MSSAELQLAPGVWLEGPAHDLPEPLERNPACVFLMGCRTDTTRQDYAYSLNTVARIIGGSAADLRSVDWAGLRVQHTGVIWAELVRKYAARTVNLICAALRGVLRTAEELELMPTRAYQRAVAKLKNVRLGTDEPSGRALRPWEVKALLDVCAADESPAGRRDAAIISLMHACGLRRFEVVGLDLADFTIFPDAPRDRAGAEILVRHGKGDKQRRNPLNAGAEGAMADWLQVRGDQPGPLFCAINKGGRLNIGEPITPQAIYNLVDKRGKEAGLASFSPHDLRRTNLTDLLYVGLDLATVQKLAGHASPITTTRYDRRGEEVKQKAVMALETPYTRRRSAS